MRKLFKGFSLIELMVAIAVIGIVLAYAVPGFRDFIGNTQIRTVTESIRNGLQLARAEAIKRNAIVSFTLNADTSWNIGCVTVTATCPATIQAKSVKEGSSDSIALSIVGNNFIRFTSLGTVDSSVPNQLSRVDVDNNSLNAADSKDLSIRVNAGGGTRMCDPNISSTSDVRYCF